jgi:hypothetical protein
MGIQAEIGDKEMSESKRAYARDFTVCRSVCGAIALQLGCDVRPGACPHGADFLAPNGKGGERLLTEKVTEEWNKITARPGGVSIEPEPEGLIARIGAWFDRITEWPFEHESRISFVIFAVIVALAGTWFIHQRLVR